QKTLDALRLRAAGNPRELALSALTSSPLPESALIAQVDAIAGEGTTRSAIDSLLASGEIERIDAESTGPGTLLFECAALRDLESRLLARLDAFHRQFPLRAGMPLEELRTALAIKSRAFEALIVRLARNEVIALAGPVARLEGFAVGLDSEAQSRAEAFLAALRESPTEPPSPAAYGVDKELLEALDHLGHVVRVSDSIVYDTATHEALVDQARDFLLEHGQMSMAEFRDLVGTTRKYAQALLEDFDRRRLTRRVGDVRHLGPAARSVDQKRTETIK
ncbi:MAG: SelB C-terminal domain-containing protein, partial [Thermomicrobiales bacterium]